ncbi:MAG: hypothetical protein N2644_10695 [Candidatus Sumerlaea chitinivorans]|nr:hypothetical protein [Candidatus Sumerlaea chitinivorans]
MSCGKKEGLPDDVIALWVQEKRADLMYGESELVWVNGYLEKALIAFWARVKDDAKFPVPRPTFLK